MTECSRCGNCCENIHLSINPADEDPNQWGSDAKIDLEFMRKHWHLLRKNSESWIFSCDQFDQESRMCTAHDDRPPICQNYPWYGKPREEWAGSGVASALPPQCSFNADVRIMLPIVEINKKMVCQ